jgi:2-amino-4-hydroxy-6-hydroxymethyldihydropteridine diphosphokinase/dihydroneopterin aldolase
VKVELRGLELYGYHGVLEQERERGQRFVYDIELEVGERGAGDRIEEAVDYRRVAETVRDVNDRRFDLLEALATAVADTLLARFPVEGVRVRVRKPEVRPAGIEVEFSAVTAERTRPSDTRLHGESSSESLTMTVAYVGLGSNLGDREAAILGAAARLEAKRLSAIRETGPWGKVDQPRFLNAVAEVETELPARALLERLLQIEREFGRTRDGERWGPRTLDLDLLLYGSERLEEPGLSVPHPHLHERLFVLEPLAELDPGLEVPGKGQVQHLLRAIQSPS